jgi:hypothetical protein
MSLKEVTKQDIYDTVFSGDFHYDQFVALITKHIEIQIPDKFGVLQKEDHEYEKKDTEGNPISPFTDVDNALREELVDYVFDQLQKQDEPEESIDNVNTKEPPEDLPDVPNEKLDIPEIKIDLGNEASSEPSSAEDKLPNLEEPVEVDVPTQGAKDVPPYVEEESEELEVSAPARPVSTSPSSAPPYADRKSHIIALVKESKWTLKQIISIIDDSWGYAAQGKSSKTRVSKTVKDLRNNNLVNEEMNGILSWKG